MAVTPQTHEYISQLVEAATGIVLDSRKGYLLESRLGALATSAGATDIDALARRLQSANDAKLRREVIEALLTHESYFFRDEHYFDVLAKSILPELIAQRQATRELAIWCAACAAGQEVYSLAMLLREQFAKPLDGWRVTLIASDYSRSMLARARDGIYNQAEASRGLSPDQRSRHFAGHDGGWRVDASLREMVEFRELNLVTPWSPLPAMDLVLLRNVLIYMSDDAKQRILKRMQSTLRPGGYLVLGATETLYDRSAGFERADVGVAGIYLPTDPDAAAR